MAAKPKSLAQLESLFLALADKTRLRILNLIGDDEICVGQLVEVLGESQPKISRHLAYLRNAGVVAVRRDGKWMHYRVDEQENEIAAEMIDDLIAGLGAQEEMQKERRRLEEIGGITRKIVKTKKAAAARSQKRSEKRSEEVEDYRGPEREFVSPPEEEPPVKPHPEPAADLAERPYQRQELETFLL